MTKRHLQLNIENTLRHFVFEDWRGVCLNPTGDYLSPDEVFEGLKNQLAQGQKVIPVCDSLDECPDFDYSGGGCPGHEVLE